MFRRRALGSLGNVSTLVPTALKHDSECGSTPLPLAVLRLVWLCCKNIHPDPRGRLLLVRLATFARTSQLLIHSIGVDIRRKINAMIMAEIRVC